MNYSYFTRTTNVRSKIISYLKKAEDNISIAMAWFTNRELFAEVMACLDRGVKVELVLLYDAINFSEIAPDFNEFIGKECSKFRLFRKSEYFLHHKFCIIDNKYLITGSYNWTSYAEDRNLENIVISDDADVIRHFNEEFDYLIVHGDNVDSVPKYTNDQIRTLGDVDFHELNRELECYSIENNIPFQKLFKSEISIVDTPIHPISKYNIGVYVKEELKTIIKKGQSLPCTEYWTGWSFKKDRNNMVCKIVYWDDKTLASDETVILSGNINDVTCNLSDYALKVRIRISLDNNGDIHAEISGLRAHSKKANGEPDDFRFIENGKTIDLKGTYKNLIAND